MFFSKKYKDQLQRIEDAIYRNGKYTVRVHQIVGQIEFRLVQIQGDLAQIMADQVSFDAQIAAANEKLDAIGTDVTNIGAAITAEAQQISDFIASQPAGIDTSALDGVVARLGSAADSLSGTAEAVGGIFTPPEPAS